jgi:hypothetical protein
MYYEPSASVSGDNHKVEVYTLSQPLFQAFTRCHSLADLHNYGKLREVASLQDLTAQILVEKNFFKPRPYEGMSLDEDSYWGAFTPLVPDPAMGDMDGLTEPQAYEVHHLYRVLANKSAVSHATYLEAVSRYWVSDAEEGALCEAICSPIDDEKEERVPYQIVQDKNRIYIVMGEGCLAHIESGDARRTFLTAVMKALYRAASLKLVHQTPWYRLYVKCLSGRC